jgi:hypothetical protein
MVRRTEKVERNDAILDDYRADPERPYAEIALSHGISTERVRFIVTQHMRRIDPSWKKESRKGHGQQIWKTCKRCFNDFLAIRAREVYCIEHRRKGYVKGLKPKKVLRHCLSCNKSFEYSLRKLKNSTGRVGVYCSDVCRHHAMKIRPLRERGNDGTLHTL